EHACADQFKPGAGNEPRQNSPGARLVQRIGRDDDVREFLSHTDNFNSDYGHYAAGAGAEGSAGGGVAGGVALPPRILNITVPQVGHLPLMALRPFFIVSSTALEISFLALHLTQYPSGIRVFPPSHFM